MKKALLIIVAAVLLCSMISCEVNIPGVGTGTVTLTPLEAPSITVIENNTVYWGSVANASGYTVSVNGKEKEVNGLQFHLSELLTESCEAVIKVRARADGVLYSDSAWGESRTYAYEYTPGITPGTTMIDTGLGSTVNVITAKHYNDLKNGVNVLDPEKLAGMNVYNVTMLTNEPFVTSSTSIREMTTGGSMSFAITQSGEAPIYCMTLSVTQGFQMSQNVEYSTYKSQYYYVLDHYVERYKSYIEGYNTEGTFQNALSDDFLAALAKLKQDGDYDAFFDKYGTHIVASAIYGGRLNAYFSVVTNKVSFDESIKTSIEQSAKANIGKDISAGQDIKADIASKLGLKEEDINTSFYAMAYGGEPFGGADLATFNKEYSEWYKSFTESSNNALVNYASDGLIPLWTVLPDEYAELAETMEAAFYQHHADVMQSVFEGFESSEFEGGNGTVENPYQIANAVQLAKIESTSMSAHYILVDDIDLAGSKWESLGGCYKETFFTGSLSGKKADGTNYKIKNLTFTGDVEEKDNRSYYGLFGAIGANGVVTNIDFEDVNIKQTGPDRDNSKMRCFIGTVAGYCEGTVKHVNISGSVAYVYGTEGESYVGSTVGLLYGGRLEYVVNTAEVYSSRYTGIAGGIVGYANGGEIYNCENHGNVTSKCSQYYNSWAISGGVVGSCYASNKPTIIDSTNDGTVKTTTYDGWSPATHTCQKGDIIGREAAQNLQ